MSSLGFDTSNYTTSIALYNNGECIQSRKLLNVKEGERGLRQSDALFQHIKQLPDVIKNLGQISNVNAVGVSTRPRSVDGSYMPVFLAGVSFAETASAVLGVPLYKFSHQDGHIMAGILSSKATSLLEEPFIAIHASGGTTEILLCSYTGLGFSAHIIGGTKDISAGQVIDRVGVNFGCKFPCGKELDELSVLSTNAPILPMSHNDGYFNFSGLETKAVSLTTTDLHDIACGVFLSISKTFEKAIKFCAEKYSIKKVLVVGGVASSKFIKKYLADRLDVELYFASSELSSDNAFGIAALAQFRLDGR